MLICISLFDASMHHSFICLYPPLQGMDACKAELLRAHVLSSPAPQQAAPYSSASLTDSLGPTGAADQAAAGQLPQDESPEALPEQAAPGSAAPHTESQVTADMQIPKHGKKRKADTECVRAAAGTEAEAALESEGAGGQTASESYARDGSSGSGQAMHKKGSSKKALQGTLQAAFAKAKVHD